MNRSNLSESEITALELIEKACRLMGWGIMIPDDNPSQIHYFIIGTEDGLDVVIKRMNGELQ